MQKVPFHTHIELSNMRGGTVGSCVVSRSGTALETQLVAGACLERILCRACLSLLLWQPLMVLALFWLLAAQHFVFQINLVSSTVLLCSGPSECPCLGQDMIMLDIAASRRAELALRFSCALVQCPCRQCAASIQLKEEPECKLDAECR